MIADGQYSAKSGHSAVPASGYGMEALFAGGVRRPSVLAIPRVEARNSVIQQRRRRHGNHYPDHQLCPVTRTQRAESGRNFLDPWIAGDGSRPSWKMRTIIFAAALRHNE